MHNSKAFLLGKLCQNNDYIGDDAAASDFLHLCPTLYVLRLTFAYLPSLYCSNLLCTKLNPALHRSQYTALTSNAIRLLKF